MASPAEFTHSDSILFSGQSEGNLTFRKWHIERSNLLNIAKICIKSLIDFSHSAGTGRILTEEFPILEQFFIILERIIRHGLKPKRTLLGPRKEFFGVLESLENELVSLPNILTNIRNLPDIKTNIGRTRAWIRLALMQKVLAEQMSAILENIELLSEWYEKYSLLLSEEGSIIAGMLVGLNVLDCNFNLKGCDLDNDTGIIDISLYLRDGNYLEKTFEQNSFDDPSSNINDHKVEMILDQKAYLEQLNKSLNDSVISLKQEAQDRRDKDKSIDNGVEDLRNRLVSVIAERERFKIDYENLLEKYNKSLEIFHADIDIERETYRQSSTGLNEMFLEVTKKFELECMARKELQIIVDEQRAMNQEKQVAMQLLEKDIHDKQDTLISLRCQLDDIKKINIELHNKLLNNEESLKKNTSEWSSTEKKCSRMITLTKEMEKQVSVAESSRLQAEDIAHQIGAKLAKVQAEKFSLDTDIKVERQWRFGLQAELEAEKEKCEKMRKDLDKANHLEIENEDLRIRLEKAVLKLSEQDITLLEMGNKLNETHAQVDEMKELHAAMKENQWLDDKDAADCKACDQPFSLARRKHHCRNCGGIFCNSCSDNTMPLPAFSKPVRVCDTCQEQLLARYSSGTS